MKTLTLTLSLSILPLTFSVSAHVDAVVLMYHTITEHSTDMNTRPENFQQQIDYLHANHFNVISSLDLVNAIKTKTSLPPKSVVITFDDGWASQKNAMDKLIKYNYPATFALVTEYQMYKNKTYLQKSDFDTYKNYPFTYVNHSHTHFTKDFLGRSDYDVSISKAQMIKNTGQFVPVYIYPYGLKTPKLLKAIKNNGYQAGFGVGAGTINVNTVNIFNINRYLINDKVSLAQFEAIVNKTI